MTRAQSFASTILQASWPILNKHTVSSNSNPHSHLEYLNSVEGDDALATELEDEHEH